MHDPKTIASIAVVAVGVMMQQPDITPKQEKPVEIEQQTMECEGGVCSIKNRPSRKVIKEEISVEQESPVMELVQDSFATVINAATKPVIVDFYATWCGPCKKVKPIFEELAKQESHWVFATIDVDKAPEIAKTYNIQAMPTFLIFKNGIQWGAVNGALEKEQLRAAFQKIIESQDSAEFVQKQLSAKFMAAIQTKQLDMVKKCIAEGVDVKGMLAVPNSTVAPLQVALAAGSKEIIDCLMTAGAVMNDEIKAGISKQIEDLQVSREKLQKSFAYATDFIPSKVVKETPVTIHDATLRMRCLMAITSLDTSLLKDLISTLEDVNTIFSFGNGDANLLYLAIVFSKNEAIEMLVAAGACLDVEIRNPALGNKATIEQHLTKDIENFNQNIALIEECFSYAEKKVTL